MDDGADDYFLSDTSSEDEDMPVLRHEPLNGIEELDEGPIQSSPAKRTLVRYNSTSSVKIENTMAKPNHFAIINAIAACVHSLLASSAAMKSEQTGGLRDFDEPCYLVQVSLFDSDSSDSEEEKRQDMESIYPNRSLGRKGSNKENVFEANIAPQENTFVMTDIKKKTRRNEVETLPPPPAVTPSQTMIRDYLAKMFFTAKCSEECHIICLVYIRRLIKSCGSPLQFNAYNWKPVLMTCLLLASKVWDDLSMVNDDFSIFMPYTIEQINRWELKFLWILQYNVGVPASEYTKVYFEMRSFAHQNGYENLPSAQCDVPKAQKLELLSKMEKLNDSPFALVKRRLRRTKSDASDERSPAKNRFLVE